MFLNFALSKIHSYHLSILIHAIIKIQNSIKLLLSQKKTLTTKQQPPLNANGTIAQAIHHLMIQIVLQKITMEMMNYEKICYFFNFIFWYLTLPTNILF